VALDFYEESLDQIFKNKLEPFWVQFFKKTNLGSSSRFSFLKQKKILLLVLVPLPKIKLGFNPIPSNLS
jgi:hypothetical protein